MRKIIFACLLAIISLQNVSAQVETQQPQGDRPRGEVPGRPPHGGRPGRLPGMGRPGGPGSHQTDIKYSGDTYITSLKGDASRIKSNGHRLFVDGKQMTNE